jgi:uncharacterized membrane protein
LGKLSLLLPASVAIFSSITHTNMTSKEIIAGFLVIHIAGGTTALMSGLFSMLSQKGGKAHRLAGKIYFAGMSAVFVGAVVVAIAHQNDFLLMVGFFSYYMTVRGYRILSLKQLNKGQKFAPLDWAIISISAIFIFTLLGWGFWAWVHGSSMGIVALVFGFIGLTFLVNDIKSYINPPTEKMHWWYTHIASMGGSYIAAFTAFVVVNVQLPQFQWVLWVLPSAMGGYLIRRTIKKYKRQFAM